MYAWMSVCGMPVIDKFFVKIYICVWVCDWKNFTECFGTFTMWNCLKCVKLCVLERIWIPGVSFSDQPVFSRCRLPIRLKPKVYQVLSAPIEYVCLYVCNCQLRNFGTKPEPYCQIITIHSSSHSNLKVSTWIIVSKKKSRGIKTKSIKNSHFYLSLYLPPLLSFYQINF